jgi:hypothetical protein
MSETEGTTMTTEEAMDVATIEADCKRSHAERLRRERPGFAAQLDQEAEALEHLVALARLS